MVRLVGHPVFPAQPARLERGEHAQDLLAAPAHAQAVDDLILHQPLGIDDEQPSHGNLLPGLVNSVSLRDRAVRVAGQREVQPPQPSPGRRGGHPPLVLLDRSRSSPPGSRNHAARTRRIAGRGRSTRSGRSARNRGDRRARAASGPGNRPASSGSARDREPRARKVERGSRIADESRMHHLVTSPRPKKTAVPLEHAVARQPMPCQAVPAITRF